MHKAAYIVQEIKYESRRYDVSQQWLIFNVLESERLLNE